MIESVSNSTTQKKIGVMDKVTQEQLYNPGLYAMPELMAMPQPQRQSSPSFWVFLGEVILGAAAIGLGAIALRRYIPALSKDKLLTTEAPKEGAKFMERIKYDFARATDWLENNTIGLIKKSIADGKKAKTTADTNPAAPTTPAGEPVVTPDTTPTPATGQPAATTTPNTTPASQPTP